MVSERINRLMISKEEQAKVKTRLSLTDIDEMAKFAFSGKVLDEFSLMLSECTVKNIKFLTLNRWIERLDALRKEYKQDQIAVDVILFYRAKLHHKRYHMAVNRTTTGGKNILLKRPRFPVSYKTARVELWRIAKEKVFDGAKRWCSVSGFFVSDKQFVCQTRAEATQWQMLLRWFIFDENSGFDVEKSVYIHGLTGRGKTFIFECLQELGQWIIKSGACPENEAHFYDWHYVDLNVLHRKCSGLAKEGDKPSFAPAAKLKYKNWCIDELCNEDLMLKVFAKEYRFFETILTDRERCKTSAKRTLFIGNNSVVDLHKYYANDPSYDYKTNESRFSSRWNGMVGENTWYFHGEKDLR